MSQVKAKLLKKSFRLHRWLGWLGGVSLLVFGLSGMMHPIMSWTGPKGAAYFPPKAHFNAGHVRAISNIVLSQGMTKAIALKLIPSEQGPLLQITEHNDQPRRYFNLESLKEIENYDLHQAQWLARYYTGLPDADILAVSFQTEFDADYPWVNRLLPVYKVQFDTPDQRIAYIYTELGVMASLTNDWKRRIQTLFRTLHTWSWLESVENVRVLIVLGFIGALFGLAVTGVGFILSIKRRSILQPHRRWHHRLAYIVWLPILAYCVSGSYHLLQFAYGGHSNGLELPEPFTIDLSTMSASAEWLKAYEHQPLNAVSIIQGPQAQLLFRLSHAPNRKKVTKNQHFSGVATEYSADYYLLSGVPAPITDKMVAQHYAIAAWGLDPKAIDQMEKIDHFGPQYDFRNKRLPVWLIKTNQGSQIFIDPATGFKVDENSGLEQLERYSFSFLHKLNFLVPFVGRQWRDVFVVVLLSLALGFTIIGYCLLYRYRYRQSS